MSVFDPLADAKQVEKVLGERPPKFTDGYLKIAFANQAKLVHFEEEGYDLDKARHNRVVFVIPTDEHFGAFLRSTVFNVSGGESKEGKCFVLWDFCHLEEDGQVHKGPCPLLE